MSKLSTSATFAGAAFVGLQEPNVEVVLSDAAVPSKIVQDGGAAPKQATAGLKVGHPVRG